MVMMKIMNIIIIIIVMKRRKRPRRGIFMPVDMEEGTIKGLKLYQQQKQQKHQIFKQGRKIASRSLVS